MTNDEIHKRLKHMAGAIPHKAASLIRCGTDPVARELELLNVSATAIWWLLGEIVLRMPEAPHEEEKR